MWKNVGIDKSLMLKISLSHMTRNKKHSPQLPFLRIYVIYGKPVGTGHLIIYHSGPSIFLIMIGSCNTYAMVPLNYCVDCMQNVSYFAYKFFYILSTKSTA